MASHGMDAAEGDESRSTASSTRATGWRIPSLPIAQSGLPAAWADFAPAPAAPIVVRPFPTEVSDANETGEPEPAATTRRRRWSLRRKRREREPIDLDAPADIDLVALGADDDRAWTDLALAELEEPAPTDADAAMPGLGTPDSVHRAGDDPWAVLADELRGNDPHHFTEPAPSGPESTTLELEQEFWA